jgi:hypothetical protein
VVSDSGKVSEPVNARMYSATIFSIDSFDIVWSHFAVEIVDDCMSSAFLHKRRKAATGPNRM